MPPSANLALVVVIPSYDEPELLGSLQALLECRAPLIDVEIIVVLNDAEKDDKSLKIRHLEQHEALRSFSRSHKRPDLQIHPIYQTGLPSRHAGVGLARKIGMDEAVRRLEQAGHPEGVIACFDADSRCDANYLQEVYRLFARLPGCPACSIYYEHPIGGSQFDEKVYEAIALYELHLRYYLHAQRFAGFPFAFETIGSSMAVRASAYQQQGGMNRRKAGEDFYFLHKFTAHPDFCELRSTRVIPSPRTSDRVPFGTGKAMSAILQAGGTWSTYAPQSLEDLKKFFAKLPDFYTSDNFANLPQSIRQYLESIDFGRKLKEIRQHTASRQSFAQRFFRQFDAFQIMKYMHFARDAFYPNVDVREAAAWLANRYFQNRDAPDMAAKDLLCHYRQMDRQGFWPAKTNARQL